MSDSEVLVQRVQHGQDGGGDGRGVRLDSGAGEGARGAVDTGHEERRVGRRAGHHHVVATGMMVGASPFGGRSIQRLTKAFSFSFIH